MKRALIIARAAEAIGDQKYVLVHKPMYVPRDHGNYCIHLIYNIDISRRMILVSPSYFFGRKLFTVCYLKC